MASSEGSSRPDDPPSFCNNPGGRSGDNSRSPTPPAGWQDHRPSHSQRASDLEDAEEAFKKLAHDLRNGADLGGASSICVLDTNTLCSARPLVESLFERLLQIAADCYRFSSPPPPFTILIPYFVMRELDGLKSSSRAVAKKAREATHWLAKAAQDQKFLRGVKHPNGYLAQEGADRKVHLPTHHYPLWVQQSRQARPRRHNQDVDDALISLCLDVQNESGLPVMFCSNDTNARVRAEGEGVRTFDLDTVLKYGRSSSSSSPGSSSASIHSDTPNNAAAAQMLLEQWVNQLGLSEHSQSRPGGPVITRDCAATSAIASVSMEEESMELDDDPVTPLPGAPNANSSAPASAPQEVELNPYTEPPVSPPRNRSRHTGRARASDARSSTFTATPRGLGLAASIHARPTRNPAASSSRTAPREPSPPPTRTRPTPSSSASQFTFSVPRSDTTARVRPSPYASAARSHRVDSATSDGASAGLGGGTGPARIRSAAGRSTSDSRWAPARRAG